MERRTFAIPRHGFGHFLVQGDFMHVSGDLSGNSFYAFFGVRF